MKRVLFKIILPAGLVAAWMLTCYPVCNKADGFDVFLYWILVGCPYGIAENVHDSCAKRISGLQEV